MLNIQSNKTQWRSVYLVGTVVLAGAILIIPTVVYPGATEPIPIALAQVLVSGVLLGLGRQGIDVLIARLFVASIAILVAIILKEPTRGLACSGPLACAQVVALTTLFLGTFGAIVLSVVAVPTSIVWNHGLKNLKPEFQWTRLQLWQWLFIVLVAVLVLGALLGIPWPQ